MPDTPTNPETVADLKAQIARLALEARDAEPAACLDLHRQISALQVRLEIASGELRHDCGDTMLRRVREPVRELRVGRFGPPNKRQ